MKYNKDIDTQFKLAKEAILAEDPHFRTIRESLVLVFKDIESDETDMGAMDGL